MRHTLKWSFFIGTAVAGAVIALLRIFQPIRYEHLVFFGYAFVGSSVIAGYVVHKNLEKRNYKVSSQNIARTDGGSAGFIGVQKVQIGGDDMKDNPKKEAETVPGFVPASKFLAESGDFENISSDAGVGAIAKSSPESEAENGRHQSAEKFLDEIEKEEVEKEIRKTGTDTAESIPQQKADVVDKNFLRHCGRRAKIFTNDTKTISGKFSGMDTHVVLEDALYGPEKKSLLLISKSEIARMEIE